MTAIDLSRHLPCLGHVSGPAAAPRARQQSQQGQQGDLFSDDPGDSPAAASLARSSLPPVFCPFTITQDTREQNPFRFTGLHANADPAGRPLVVPISVATLQSGDYSISGCEGLIAVERKSREDLQKSLTWDRERFERELARLDEMAAAPQGWAAVVVESDWEGAMKVGPLSKVRPKAIYMSLVALPQRFPRVHWFLMPGRRAAEEVTFWALWKWWEERTRSRKAR